MRGGLDESILTDASGFKGTKSVRSIFPQSLQAKPSYVNPISSGKSDNLEKVLKQNRKAKPSKLESSKEIMSSLERLEKKNPLLNI